MRRKTQAVTYEMSRLTDDDIRLFEAGTHFRLYEKLGSHLMTDADLNGAHFGVWAPGASSVFVLGDFNGWNPESHPLKQIKEGSGIWEGFVPGVGKGAPYKYRIVSRAQDYEMNKGDPFAFFWQAPPSNASVVWDLEYEWGDQRWMEDPLRGKALHAAVSIYEVHLGSWRREQRKDGGFLSYREIAAPLAEYVKQMGFTHVEFLPVMEHPFYGSWGYQTVGYFAPTNRYGPPQDFMYLTDFLHQAGIGVILDWVPSHFPSDEYGLSKFDGTPLYEYAEPQKGFHPEWTSCVFNYGNKQVRAFLISNALFWLDRYHIEGLRVDAVASMLYLDYARKQGEWIPNELGGRENLEAVAFLRSLNEAVDQDYPHAQTVAEESTAWPMISRPTDVGGLGFGMKWNMGWMHDTLKYLSFASDNPKRREDELTFSIWYAFSENFVLPLSHDEVVYGKGSLIDKMPGDEWEKLAHLRLLFGWMYAHPGKKLLFMGNEFAQRREWNHDTDLQWSLLDLPLHQGVQTWVRDLNLLYRNERALHKLDFSSEGFEWVSRGDGRGDKGIIGFLRKGQHADDMILILCNFTPKTMYDHLVGVPRSGVWKPVLDSDQRQYGGRGEINLTEVETTGSPCSGKSDSLCLTLTPLTVLFLRYGATQVSNPTEKVRDPEA